MVLAKDMLLPLIEKGLTIQEFILICKDYEKSTGISLKDISYEYCPINLYAYLQFKEPCHSITAGLTVCPICNNPCCPTCYNHNVNQLSRVTGYIGSVGGWNEGKKQELKDRKRYNI